MTNSLHHKIIPWYISALLTLKSTRPASLSYYTSDYKTQHATDKTHKLIACAKRITCGKRNVKAKLIQSSISNNCLQRNNNSLLHRNNSAILLSTMHISSFAESYTSLFLGKVSSLHLKISSNPSSTPLQPSAPSHSFLIFHSCKYW